VPSDFNYLGPDKSVQWFATGRGRIGYAIDNILIYGTAGFAYANLKSQSCGSGNCSTNKLGYAAGAGGEYAFTQNWSVKVEGLYVNFGKSPAGIIGVDNFGRTYSGGGKQVNNDLAIVRAGLNYRF
jgi:outer membrane immunogenic protein